MYLLAKLNIHGLFNFFDYQLRWYEFPDNDRSDTYCCVQLHAHFKNQSVLLLLFFSLQFSLRHLQKRGMHINLPIYMFTRGALNTNKQVGPELTKNARIMWM